MQLALRLGYDKLEWWRVITDTTELPCIFIGMTSSQAPLLENALGVIDIDRVERNREAIPKGLRVAGVAKDSNERQRVIGVSYSVETQQAYNINVSLPGAELRNHYIIHPYIHAEIPSFPYWPYLTAGFVTQEMVKATDGKGYPHEVALRFYDSTHQGGNLLSPKAQLHYPAFGYKVDTTIDTHRISYMPVFKKKSVLLPWTQEIPRRLEVI